MPGPVDELYAQSQEIEAILRDAGEISLSLAISDTYRKSLLLAAASYFETKLSLDVQSYCDLIAGEGAPLANLARVKAISRQYHTWFDWDRPNANKFFSLFGDGFKKHMDAILKTDSALASQISDFISLGSDRNRLVHQNFGSFSLEASADEIYGRYANAANFVAGFGDRLRTYTEAHHPAVIRGAQSLEGADIQVHAKAERADAGRASATRG